MKIAHSAVNLSAQSTFAASTTKQSKLITWVGNRASMQIDQQAPAKVDISSLARKLSQETATKTKTTQTDGTEQDTATDLSDRDRQKIRIIEDLLYRITGKHIKLKVPDWQKLARDNVRSGIVTAAQTSVVQNAPQQLGYGLIYDSVDTYTEKQAMSFQGTGSVQTADGRTIDFSVQLNMSRSFTATNEVHLRAGDAAKVDPLVINLDGNGPQLTQRDFRFDIDSDGEEEQISRLTGDSGFLALDKNGDGVINDGSELFGPTMGNGFEELKAYDADGNGWIDENDPVYDKLRIWMSDEQGNMQLAVLGQKGVGAIYLGNVSSAFDVKDGGNNSLGTVRSTGVFLKEDGGAGTVQHIDLTV